MAKQQKYQLLNPKLLVLEAGNSRDSYRGSLTPNVSAFSIAKK